MRVMDTRTRLRLLFLGSNSFEIEEEGGDSEERIRIVERGNGLRRAVILVGKEIAWLAKLFRQIKRDSHEVGFLGRFSAGRRSLACWLREEAEGLAIQLVETTAEKRFQIFVPQSDFGDDWEGFALVLEGFAGKADVRKESTGFRWPENGVRVEGISKEKAEVRLSYNSESNLSEVLERCLVGRVGGT